MFVIRRRSASSCSICKRFFSSRRSWNHCFCRSTGSAIVREAGSGGVVEDDVMATAVTEVVLLLPTSSLKPSTPLPMLTSPPLCSTTGSGSGGGGGAFLFFSTYVFISLEPMARSSELSTMSTKFAEEDKKEEGAVVGVGGIKGGGGGGGSGGGGVAIVPVSKLSGERQGDACDGGGGGREDGATAAPLRL